MSEEDTPRYRPWEQDWGPEEELLHTHGFHQVRGLEDVWQLGSVDHRLKERETYARQEALNLIRERMNR